MSQFQTHFMGLESKDQYRTPLWVFEPLDKLFKFTLDPAATSENALTKDYFTQKDNGLLQDWKGHTVFNNPPFSKGQYGQWIQKAKGEFSNHGITIAQVLPFKPEVKAFDPVWDHATYLILPKTRIIYNFPSGEKSGGVTFFSCIVLWTNKLLSWVDIDTIKPIGRMINLRNIL